MSYGSEHLFVIDCLPEFKNDLNEMKPHQSFVYKLGLELCMSFITRDDDVASEYEPKFVDELHKRNNCFRLPSCQCQTCGFRTESRLVMDSHLTEPHHFSSSNVCNFCPNFKAKSREKYLHHVQTVHKRVPKVEKPFVSDSLMCPICDYETNISTVNPKQHDLERTQNHIKNNCPFRENNCDMNPLVKIDYNQILANNLSPSLFDLLDYEYIFNSKPKDSFVNKYNLFSSSLMKTNSLLASMALQEESFLIHQTKLLETMIHNSSQNEHAKKNKIIPNSKKINQISPDNSIRVLNNISVKNSLVNNKPIQSISYDTNPIKCDLCPVSFNGVFALVNYETHLKSVHSMRNLQDLRACLSKCFRPVETKTSPQNVKVIKINQNLVLVKKTANEKSNLTPAKRPIELIELDKDEIPNKCAKSNENTDIFVQIKLKEIEAEKKFIFSLLNIRKNDSDLVELKGIQGTCYICKQLSQNILSHLLVEHHIDASKSLQLNRCILCGNEPLDKNELIKHQYHVHNIISFLSLNKIFTVDKSLEKKQESTTSTDDNDCIIIDNENNDVSINLKISSQNGPTNNKVNESKLAKKCIKCAKEFDTFIQLLNHVKKDHENLAAKNHESDKKASEVKKSDSLMSASGKKCQFCDIEIESSSELELHLVKHHMKAFEIRLKKIADIETSTKARNVCSKKQNKKYKENSIDHSHLRRSSRIKK